MEFVPVPALNSLNRICFASIGRWNATDKLPLHAKVVRHNTYTVYPYAMGASQIVGTSSLAGDDGCRHPGYDSDLCHVPLFSAQLCSGCNSRRGQGVVRQMHGQTARLPTVTIEPGFEFRLDTAGGNLALTALNEGVPVAQNANSAIYLPLVTKP